MKGAVGRPSHFSSFPASLPGPGLGGFHIPSPILLQRQCKQGRVLRGQGCLLFGGYETGKSQYVSATFLGNRVMVVPTFLASIGRLDQEGGTLRVCPFPLPDL